MICSSSVFLIGLYLLKSWLNANFNLLVNSDGILRSKFNDKSNLSSILSTILSTTYVLKFKKYHLSDDHSLYKYSRNKNGLFSSNSTYIL